jgi:hypothetical protein
MWIGWAIAGLVAAGRRRAARPVVIAAAVLMLVVYLIPHSAQGSQLDYTRLEADGAALHGPTP